MKKGYKYYQREGNSWTKSNWGHHYQTEFIRECELHGSRWYTIRWWAKQEDGSWKHRRNKKYVAGAKLIKDLTDTEAAAMLFVDSL